MRIWLVEILVRLGVAVIADGRCRPRWYGSDQERVCRTEQRNWWHRPFGVGAMFFGRKKLTAAEYYLMRERVTGSGWQFKQYIRGAIETMWPSLDAFERNVIAALTLSNYRHYKHLSVVRRLLS